MPISLPRELQKRTQKSKSFFVDFVKDFGSNLTPKLAPNWTTLATSGVHFRASAAKPGQHGSRQAPRPPKAPSRPQFSWIFSDFWNDFLIHFWTHCLQNVIDNFSGNSAVQPVSEKSPFKLFPTFLQKPSHNTFHTRGSSSKIAKLRGPAVTREASSIYKYI